MRFYSLLVLYFFVTLHVNSQTVYQYDFDGCGLTEVSGTLSDLTVTGGNPDCVCGPINDALQFDGNADQIEMPLPGDLLRRDNYTFSFYMRPSGGGGAIQQVFSNRRMCGTSDSLFSVQYFPNIQSVTFRLSDFGATVGFIDAGLNVNECWNQVTLVKSGRILQLFVNGIEQAEFAGNQPINIFSNEPIAVGRTLCGPGQNISDYSGALDQITWFDRALTPAEVQQHYTPIDEVITTDTLIFSGDQFLPRVASSCASNIVWTPSTGLSNANDVQPVIAPTETQNYMVEYNYGDCTARDSLRVVVVEEEDVDCQKILLPTAFTPNGDNLNDAFGVSNSFIIDELIQFEIMDRQGNTLFSAETREDKWDGFYRGKVMTSGVYVYKLSYECKGEEFSRTGRFNIIR